ncbi:sensor histidine kinase [Paenibacillus rhizoplanae]
MWGAQSKGVFTTQVKDKDSYVIIDEMIPELSVSRLKIISVFETKSILSDANKVSQLGLFIVIGVLLVALVLVYTISLLTSNRLLRLSRQLNQVALGNLNVVSHIDGTDEIGQLSRQFNYMVASINQLIKQVIESNEKNSTLEIAQREIKLKMMASQIHPHFSVQRTGVDPYERPPAGREGDRQYCPAAGQADAQESGSRPGESADQGRD